MNTYLNIVMDEVTVKEIVENDPYIKLDFLDLATLSNLHGHKDDCSDNSSDSSEIDDYYGDPDYVVDEDESYDCIKKEEIIYAQPKSKTNSCPLCVKSFLNPSKLVRHMRSHTKEKPFTCPICAKGFAHSYHMTKHLRRVHGDMSARGHDCSICGGRFCSLKELKVHKRTHLASDFSCPYCDVKFQLKTELLNHMMLHKTGQTNHLDPQSLICTECGKMFNKTSELNAHMVTHDKLESLDLATISSLQGHKDECSNNSSDSGKIDDYCGDPDFVVDEDESYDCIKKEEIVYAKPKSKTNSCPICVKSFLNPSKLVRHMRSHTKEKPFTCPICAKGFAHGYHKNKHLRRVHGDMSARGHDCSICGGSFSSLKELNVHRRTHLPSEFSCPDCDMKFQLKTELLSHIMLHEKGQKNCLDPQSLICTECGKVFNKTSELNAHMVTHDKLESLDLATISSLQGHKDECSDDSSDSGEMDIESGNPDFVVDKNFNHNAFEDEGYDGVKREEIISAKSKSKKHSCPFCIMSFLNPSKLTRHMRTHTKEKPFTCPICARAFVQDYHMTRHIRRVHGTRGHLCSKCGGSFSSLKEFNFHRRSHLPNAFSCPDCDMKFKIKTELLHHRITSHKEGQKCIDPQSLICTECGKMFNKTSKLKTHMVTHDTSLKYRYSCNECHRKFALLEDLQTHKIIHQIGNNETCPKCNQTFSSPVELENHMESHDESYSCNDCGKKFKLYFALKKHEERHKEGHLLCTRCDKFFTKTSHYEKHMMVHEKRNFTCPHCQCGFLKLSVFKNHLRTHIEERPYQCSCCVESFTKEDDLELHCLKHRVLKKQKPYSCSRCEYAFSSLLELTKHMSIHSKDKPVNCPHCGKMFVNKARLEKHLNVHSSLNSNLCSICGHLFSSSLTLKQHMMGHTGEKPHRCTQCGKCYRSASGLRVHSRVHMAEPPRHRCTDCGRTYGRFTELRWHQRCHTGDKPHVCTCCSKCFASKDKLSTHMRTHTGERPYSCTHCEQTFTQSGDRNRHIRKYHSQ